MTRPRDIIIGVLVAAGLAGGILFTRLRHQPVAAGNGPPVGLDISAADGRMTVDGTTVEVSVEPRPARPFENLRFRFHFEPAVTEAHVSFNMTMDMGPHHYRLVRDGEHWLARDVVLPECGSGSRLWFGDLELRDATGTTRRGRFEINLAPVD